MNDKSKVSEEGPRSFAVVLQQVADGQCHIDASEELHALLAECARVANATRGEAKGELLLKLSFSVEAEPSSLVSPQPAKPASAAAAAPRGQQGNAASRRGGRNWGRCP